MVSLFLVIFLVLTVLFSAFYIKKTETGNEDVGCFCLVVAIVAGLVSVIFLIWEFNLINQVGTGHTIDEMIAMYEEENQSIEESLDVVVKSYMDYEAKVYSEFKEEDSISLVSLIPELKADTLVQKQIEVYLANNEQIKKLKKEKIDLSKAK